MPDVAAEESTISYEALTKKVKIFENCSPTELKASATYSGIASTLCYSYYFSFFMVFCL